MDIKSLKTALDKTLTVFDNQQKVKIWYPTEGKFVEICGVAFRQNDFGAMELLLEAKTESPEWETTKLDDQLEK